ncbi:hypothetical protein GUJ93_ZPchr0010g10707 [Zizania palustris]|uniref:Uncharacterized protein n=1 Tax=Zizania palustris TaxID=103762 RepID=A0A8J6BGC7_ZIZPA|nr:hypothetical protein GUJ93_ZPchr0010g10707 [Zizania palustris]
MDRDYELPNQSLLVIFYSKSKANKLKELRSGGDRVELNHGVVVARVELRRGRWGWWGQSSSEASDMVL